MRASEFFRKLYTPRSARPPHDLPGQIFPIAVRICGWGILALLPVYCLLMMEYIHYADKARFATFFLERMPVVLFDIGLLYLLYLCVLCICKKGWISVLVFGGVCGIVSYVNYLKHAMTGDYFYPWDFFEQAGKAGELLHFITVPFPLLYWCFILFVPVMAVIVYFAGASLPLAWSVRIPAAALVAGCMVFSVSTPDKITGLLNRNSLYLEDMALQTSNYSANGFVGAFTVNILSANVQMPEDYSENTVTSLLADCTDTPAAENFSSPDIIVVLSESFWDPTLLPGTTFSRDPLANYRALCAEENTVSGRFFTTGFGGGTVRPEFEVLTGLTTDYLPSGCVPWQYITEQTDSYVSVYKDLGYTTMAVHPYTSSFYCRKDAYPDIGIDSLYFEDEIYALGQTGEITVTTDGGQISDETFVDSVIYYLEQNSDPPVFLYGISMENHQPYTDKYASFPITVENSALDETVLNAVRNFTQGVSHADAALGRLADYVKNRDRDTVLVWFGDHLPTLGSNMGAYAQSGMVGTYDVADYEALYSTPFLIYANFDLATGDTAMLRAGSDNSIASYNLLNATAQLIGAPRSAYMQYLERYYSAIPYYNIRLHMPIDGDAAYYANGHKMLTYDVVAGQRYLYNK
ncbi:MAG: LTA synthase family protein [Clostridia bacterium]|nr:LTA synthase family protein [Clostridia bacterium]